MTVGKITQYGDKKGNYLRVSIPSSIVKLYGLDKNCHVFWRPVSGGEFLEFIDENGDVLNGR